MTRLLIRTSILLASVACIGVGGVLTGCASDNAEVVIVNELAEDVLVRSISFNGCKWSRVLAYGEASAPQFCLVGQDRIHFQKLDGSSYCSKRRENADTVNAKPAWYNYQTVSVKRVKDGSFSRFVLTDNDLEQDFALPLPHGH